MLALGMIVVFAHLSWLVNLSALVVDIMPDSRLGTTFGIIAAGSSAGGIAMNWAVGQFVDRFTYVPAFLIMAVLPPLALMVVWPLRKR